MDALARPLIAEVAGPDDHASCRAMLALGALGARSVEPIPGAAAAILAQLDGPSQMRWYYGLEALAVLRDRAAVAALARWLDPVAGKPPGFRAAATAALGAIGGPEALAILVRQLDTAPELRSATIRALDETREPGSLEPLVRALGLGVGATPYAMLALFRRHQVGGHVVDALVAALGSENAELRKAAARALRGALHERAIPALEAAREAAGPDERRVLDEVLAALRDASPRSRAP